MSTTEDSVDLGVRWLDDHAPPQWWDLIDYDRLDIDEPKHCILGQVFAAKADETGLINGYIYATVQWALDPVYFGFCPSGSEYPLREEWIERIEARRFEVSA